MLFYLIESCYNVNCAFIILSSSEVKYVVVYLLVSFVTIIQKAWLYCNQANLYFSSTCTNPLIKFIKQSCKCNSETVIVWQHSELILNTLLQVSDATGKSHEFDSHKSSSRSLDQPISIFSEPHTESPSPSYSQQQQQLKQTETDSVPAALASTLEHIVGQLDVLTQVDKQTQKHLLLV